MSLAAQAAVGGGVRAGTGLLPGNLRLATVQPPSLGWWLARFAGVRASCVPRPGIAVRPGLQAAVALGDFLR